MSNATIRIAADSARINREPTDARTGERIFFYAGNSVRLEVGLFTASALADIDSIATITAEVKLLGATASSSAFMQEVLSSVATITEAQWLAGTHQHAAFEWDADEANLTTGDYLLTIWSTGTGGEVTTWASGRLRVFEDGGGLDVPVLPTESQYYDAETSDARYALKGESAGFTAATAAVYVAKHGSDDNDGLTPDRPLLTIAAGIVQAAALQLAGAERVRVDVLDSGIYTENIAVTAEIQLHAPTATLIGTCGMDGACAVTLHRHVAALKNTSLVAKTGGIGHGFYRADVLDGRGLAGTVLGVTCLRNQSNGSILFAYVGVVYVGGAGVGVQDSATGFGHIHFWTPDLYLFNNSVGIKAQNASNLIGYIDHILIIDVDGLAINTTHASAVVKLTATEIIAGNVTDLTAGNVFLTSARLEGKITRANASNLYVSCPYHDGAVTSSGAGGVFGLLGANLYGVTVN